MRLRYLIAGGLLAVVGVVTISSFSFAANEYGSGSYGACTYNECGISLSTNTGTVSLPVTPTATGVCTVASNIATVTTDSSTGYTLSLAGASSSLNRAGGGAIAATAGTTASPAALGMNRWGYRVDGSGAFGAGPTAALSNSAIPAQTFAAVPTAHQAIVQTTSAASAGATTNVWFGTCVNTSTPSGTYTTNVTYTAVVN